MELPTYNRKKVIDIWLTGLVAKIDPFSIFWKVISRKPLDLHRWKCAQIFFQALSASVPNFIEIGGGSRRFSKKLVDLTRNDPCVPNVTWLMWGRGNTAPIISTSCKVHPYLTFLNDPPPINTWRTSYGYQLPHLPLQVPTSSTASCITWILLPTAQLWKHWIM